jgi:prophage antirepressor-like protein
METQQQSQYPARVEAFNGDQVNLFEIEGKDYLTGEDIGICLGMGDPRKAINNIYHRNREELEPHTCVLNLRAQGQNRATRLFDETGCNLITIFARTPKARAFRLWLAKLPKKVRQAQENLPAVLEQVERRGMAKAAFGALALMDSAAVQSLGPGQLHDLIWYRCVGLTQKETSILLQVSKDRVQEVEHSLKSLGLHLSATSRARRRAQTRQALVGPEADHEHLSPR